MKLTCPECGVEFEGFSVGQCCGDQCKAEHKRRKAREREARQRAREAEARVKDSERKSEGRRCASCGRPTTDYRCAACWAKLRQANGEPMFGELGSDEWIFN